MAPSISVKSASLRGKMLVAGTILVGVIVALAGLLYSSASQYEYHLQRINLAHSVLSGFQSISDHAYRKLNAMGQIGAQGHVDNVEARVENERQLWAAVSSTRALLDQEARLAPDPSSDGKVARLLRIEQIVEQIIEGGATIRDAVSNGNTEVIAPALANLRSPDIAGQFNRFIDEAIAEERAVVQASRAEATRLSRFINSALPGAILITLIVGLIATVTISRSLTRSLSGLKEAADAYTSGDLEHRSVAFPDTEFRQLGEAFNRMAEELAARRSEAERSQEFLEREVVERTQELAHTLKQLELVDAKRRQFLADISHEIRTPLTLIQGEADMVMRGAEKSSEQYREAISRIREQAGQTTRLVKDLLLVARSEEGNLHLESKPVQILNLIEEVCLDFRSSTLKHELTIEQAHSVTEAHVQGDADRLRQVFAILLDNAIRYSDQGSIIRIESLVADSCVEVFVKNSGSGLAPNDAGRVFDRFFRGDNASKRSEGSGLGLPVAKAIVEAHQGEISLFSRDGQVLVHIQIPLRTEQDTKVRIERDRVA